MNHRSENITQLRKCKSHVDLLRLATQVLHDSHKLNCEAAMIASLFITAMLSRFRVSSLSEFDCKSEVIEVGK